MIKNYLSAVLLLASLNTFAGGIALEDIKESDFNNITKEFAANFTHSAVTTPGKLGTIFGFEVGIVGGATDAKKTSDFAKTIDSSSDFSKLYHAGLMGRVSVPFGLSAEAVMIPQTEFSGIEIETFSGALSYDFSSLLPIPFLDLALKAHFASGSVGYKTSDSISNVPVDSSVEVKTSSYGVNVSAGLGLLIVEPYVGVGFISSETKMKVDATSGTIFDSSFTTGKSAKKSHSGAHYFAGANVNLLIMHIGAEYENVFGVNKYTAKLSFGF